MSLDHHTLVNYIAQSLVSLACLSVRVSVVFRSGMEWAPVRRDVAFAVALLGLRSVVCLYDVLRFPAD